MKILIFKTLLIFYISINIAYSKDLDHLESLSFYEEGKLIIDVRNKDEWKESGVIPNAILIQMLAPDSNIRDEYLADLIKVIGTDKSKEVGIICRSGRRSSYTVNMLQEKGYTNINNISEGMLGDQKTIGWITRNYPTIPCNKECE